MAFGHSIEMWQTFPELAAGVRFVDGITPDANVDEPVARYCAIASERLSGKTESELPEIQAWRRTFSKMGLKPTQYRCASEALLRRYRIDGVLPRIHPLIDLCNSISLAFAIPVAAIDLANVSGNLEVRHATGDESYQTFSGEIEHPEPREVIFADEANQAHARRWTNRQSGLSAIRDSTSRVLIVSEAMHATAADDVARLIGTIGSELESVWGLTSTNTMLSPENRWLRY